MQWLGRYNYTIFSLNTNGKNIWITLHKKANADYQSQTLICHQKSIKASETASLGGLSSLPRFPKSLRKFSLSKTWALPLMVTPPQPVNSFRNYLCSLESEQLLHLDYALFPNFHSDLNVNFALYSHAGKMINYWTPSSANLGFKLGDLFTW